MYSELLPRLVQDRPEASSGHRASPDILSFGKKSEDGFPLGREQTVLDLTYRFCSFSYLTVIDSRSDVNSVPLRAKERYPALSLSNCFIAVRFTNMDISFFCYKKTGMGGSYE